MPLRCVRRQARFQGCRIMRTLAIAHDAPGAAATVAVSSTMLGRHLDCQKPSLSRKRRVQRRLASQDPLRQRHYKYMITC